TSPATPPGPDELRALVEDVFSPAHFFAAPGVELEWAHAPEREEPWEVFRGRLLDPAHTRQSRTFATWDVFLREEGVRSAEPLVPRKLDRPARLLHVGRGLLCYVWQGYDAGGNVYLSRETTRWVRELAGTVRLDDFAAGELRDELVSQLFHAVVGAS